jgi:hypothetical protein
LRLSNKTKVQIGFIIHLLLPPFDPVYKSK